MRRRNHDADDEHDDDEDDEEEMDEDAAVRPEAQKARHGTHERAVTGGGGYEVEPTAVQGAESSRARGGSAS